MTSPQKFSLEFKELGLPPKNRQHSPRIRTTEGVLESSAIWVSIAPLQLEGRMGWVLGKAGRGPGVVLDEVGVLVGPSPDTTSFSGSPKEAS